MTGPTTRRSLLTSAAALVAAAGLPSLTLPSLASPSLPPAAEPAPAAEPTPAADLIHLNLNENAFGPSPAASAAISREFPRLPRYGDQSAADAFLKQIAAYEQIPANQIILGEILGPLGLALGSNGGPGGEFLYSTPGYLALIDAAAHVGGVGVPVPLDANFENDLAALLAKIGPKTRALYLINPHNPTGTVSDRTRFHAFLRQASQHAPVIVDEAYLEFTPDFRERTAASLVREGSNVLVFRTFDKIHGLAGLPIGYTLAPKAIADDLRRQGFGDAESLGRLNIAAASAALADTRHTGTVRAAVHVERTKWTSVLDDLHLPHTPSVTNFIFFNAGRPHAELAAAMRAHGILIARAFPPYDHWARITIGLPAQNHAAQLALRKSLAP